MKTAGRKGCRRRRKSFQNHAPSRGRAAVINHGFCECFRWCGQSGGIHLGYGPSEAFQYVLFAQRVSRQTSRLKCAPMLLSKTCLYSYFPQSVTFFFFLKNKDVLLPHNKCPQKGFFWLTEKKKTELT